MKLGILPCNGACNTGCMTGKVALEFVDNEDINMVCALGLPLGIESITNNAKKNEKFIVLNGCAMKCASKSLDKADINNYEELILTDFGIQKNKNYKDETNIEKVKEAVKEKIDNYFKGE